MSRDYPSVPYLYPSDSLCPGAKYLLSLTQDGLADFLRNKRYRIATTLSANEREAQAWLGTKETDEWAYLSFQGAILNRDDQGFVQLRDAQLEEYRELSTTHNTFIECTEKSHQGVNDYLQRGTLWTELLEWVDPTAVLDYGLRLWPEKVDTVLALYDDGFGNDVDLETVCINLSAWIETTRRLVEERIPPDQRLGFQVNKTETSQALPASLTYAE